MHAVRLAIPLALLVLLAVPGASLAASSNDPVAPTPESDKTAGLDATCGPPCGYIWPRIGVDADVKSPFPISEIRDFPEEITVTITYSWDMEQDGTGVSDPTEEMEITVIVSRTPSFLHAQLDRNTCSFPLVPVITEYDVCELTLSVEIDERFLPGSEEELRENGHRLMLFAASEESGTFMKSYGLEDIRFHFDKAPSFVEFREDDPDVGESPAPLGALLVLGLAAAVAVLRRRA